MFSTLNFQTAHAIRISRCFLGHSRGSNTDIAHCTGYSYSNKRGERVSKLGIYFGENDSRNCLKVLDKSYTFVGAMIQAMILAIKSSSKKKLHIQTDFKFPGHLKEHLEQLENDNYITTNGNKVPNAELLRELHHIIQNKKVTFEYVPAVENGKPNYVTELLLNDQTFKSKEALSSTKSDFLKDIKLNTVYDCYGAETTMPEKKWPICYIGTKFEKEANGFASASYCTYWLGGECGRNVPHRFSLYPVTLFRAELIAIETALKQAVDCKLKNVLLVINSPYFLKYLREKWYTSSGRQAPNYFIYERILDLVNVKGFEVRYRYEALNNDNKDWKIVSELCEEGLSFPLTRKDTTEYSWTLEDITDNQELDIDGVLRARVFKYGTKFQPGIIYDKTGPNCSPTFVPWHQSSIPLQLLEILRKAKAENEKLVIIRSNSTFLIKSLKSWMPVWQRQGWRSSLHHRIKHVDTWMEIFELCKEIKVRMEYMKTIEGEDLNMAKMFQKKIKEKKRSSTTQIDTT